MELTNQEHEEVRLAKTGSHILSSEPADRRTSTLAQVLNSRLVVIQSTPGGSWEFVVRSRQT